MQSDILFAKTYIYDFCGYNFNGFLAEEESQEYGACTFTLNQHRIKFRVAKITPTKTGQFVTLWKRNAEGITQPHDSTDSFDLYVISVRKADLSGQFVFPPIVLIKQGILSTATREGKRGFRVYPPWDKTDNPQAKKTQKWQQEFFLEIRENLPVDKNQSDQLYQML